jgi:hypothetical protein
MTRLLLRLLRRRVVAHDTLLADAQRARDEADVGWQSGWHESSNDLRRGLTVLEPDDAEADAGPETRPFTYPLEAA